MTKIDLTIPKLGESVHQVQLIRFTKKIGEYVQEDEVIAEIASDKVDTEVTATQSGFVSELLFQEGVEIPIGAVFARLSTSIETDSPPEPLSQLFLSPVVKKIVEEQGLLESELANVSGTGKDGRISKNDILAYIDANQTDRKSIDSVKIPEPVHIPVASVSGTYDIIEMDKMRRIIAKRMKSSKEISPHVTAFVEADVTDLVNWRLKHKGEFQKRFNQGFTITPLLVMALVRAIQDFPMINVSVDETETKILRHHDINIGIATELPNGNLIVPVIKGANHYNVEGLALKMNDLVGRARAGKLKPDDVHGGTFTISNVGVFGNIAGTPIINQPEVAILATGTIKKKPAVMETEHGDVIAVRQFMFLSLSFDHRVVDGSLGGAFLKRIADYLERWNLHNQL